MSETLVLSPPPCLAQCFSCKQQTTVKNAEILKTKNNRFRLNGTCSDCGKSVSKFIPDPNAEKKSKETSPLAIQKKIQKSPRVRNSLRLCAACKCAKHAEIINSQPKKKRKSQKEKIAEAVAQAFREVEEKDEKEKERQKLHDIAVQVSS